MIAEICNVCKASEDMVTCHESSSLAYMVLKCERSQVSMTLMVFPKVAYETSKLRTIESGVGR
jgi:hypothetical protein